MRYLFLILMAAMLGLAGPATAAGGCALSYEAFEAGVPHTDLEECPTGLKKAGQFCRYSVVAEVATVFAFDEDSNCLVTTRQYFDDEFSVRFKGM